MTRPMQTRKTMATANNSHFTILQNKQSSTSHLATIRHCLKKERYYRVLVVCWKLKTLLLWFCILT